MVRHGWEMAFQHHLFARQYAELKNEVMARQSLAPLIFGMAYHPRRLQIASFISLGSILLPAEPLY